MTDPVIMLETIHGSHLYNLATPTSDRDSFIVFANQAHRRKAKYAFQRLEGMSDDLLTDVSTFQQYARNGVPQYLEAMWSEKATVDMLGHMRWSFRPNVYATEATYIRTARNFWEKGQAIEERADEHLESTDPWLAEMHRATKLKRHAYRLCLNLQDMRQFGRFNPSLGLRQQRELARMLHADETVDKYLGVTS